MSENNQCVRQAEEKDKLEDAEALSMSLPWCNHGHKAKQSLCLSGGLHLCSGCEGCLVLGCDHGPQAEVAQGVGPGPLVER